MSDDVEAVDEKDIVKIGRIYADNLLGEPAVSKVMHLMADEIFRLREAIGSLADQDATLSVCDGNVTVTMDATLTDEERQVIAWAADIMSDASAATLRGLLERLGDVAKTEE